MLVTPSKNTFHINICWDMRFQKNYPGFFIQGLFLKYDGRNRTFMTKLGIFLPQVHNAVNRCGLDGQNIHG